MMMRTPRSSPVLASVALGALMLAGCASTVKSDPPASAPTSPGWGTSGTAAAPRTPTVGDERDRGGAGTGSASVVPGAIPAVAAAPAAAPPANPAFAERRASEALDRLAGLVTIRHEKRGAVITMSNDRLVESGQSALTTSGQYSLRELAVGLRDQGGHVILIQGYTDSMGTAAVNEALSLRRAEAVRDYLSTQGVAAESMRAEGFGAKRPVAHNGTADGRAQNRRIEIVIAPAP